MEHITSMQEILFNNSEKFNNLDYLTIMNNLMKLHQIINKDDEFKIQEDEYFSQLWKYYDNILLQKHLYVTECGQLSASIILNDYKNIHLPQGPIIHQHQILSDHFNYFDYLFSNSSVVVNNNIEVIFEITWFIDLIKSLQDLKIKTYLIICVYSIIRKNLTVIYGYPLLFTTMRLKLTEFLNKDNIYFTHFKKYDQLLNLSRDMDSYI